MTREELEQKVNEYWAGDPAATWTDVMVFVHNAAVDEMSSKLVPRERKGYVIACARVREVAAELKVKP